MTTLKRWDPPIPYSYYNVVKQWDPPIPYSYYNVVKHLMPGPFVSETKTPRAQLEVAPLRMFLFKTHRRLLLLLSVSSNPLLLCLRSAAKKGKNFFFLSNLKIISHKYLYI